MCAIVARVGQRVCCRNKFWDVIKKVCDILRFIEAMQLTPHIFARQLNNSQVSITNREVGWWIYKRTIHHTLCETVDVKNYISFKWFRWKNWSLVVPLIWLSEFFRLIISVDYDWIKNQYNICHPSGPEPLGNSIVRFSCCRHFLFN
jgi:hypothetical protein